VGAASPTQDDNFCNTDCLFALACFAFYEKLKEKLPAFPVISVFGVFYAEHAGARETNP
jgi:hypothetical protein